MYSKRAFVHRCLREGGEEGEFAEAYFNVANFFSKACLRFRGPHQDSLQAIQTLRHTVLEDLERVIQNSTAITTVVGLFLNVERLEVGGQQEVAHNMVTRASPITAELVQCTLGSPRHPVTIFLTTVT
ncbi:unnamed protein product [Prorocentrum cordatum]|uniref:Uncharacterized protein n=1 Tax=Prorocentrum cordatum TaxID=2364126 RepID=A0ABN9SWR5_9DINO|nr:unnamed protein product [Polarella glacialis]